MHMVNLEIFPEEIGTDFQYTMNKHAKVVTNDQKSHTIESGKQSTT